MLIRSGMMIIVVLIVELHAFESELRNINATHCEKMIKCVPDIIIIRLNGHIV